MEASRLPKMKVKGHSPSEGADNLRNALKFAGTPEPKTKTASAIPSLATVRGASSSIPKPTPQHRSKQAASAAPVGFGLVIPPKAPKTPELIPGLTHGLHNGKPLPLSPLDSKPLPTLPGGGERSRSKPRPPSRLLIDAEDVKTPAMQPLISEKRPVAEVLASRAVRNMPSFREHLRRSESFTRGQFESTSPTASSSKAPAVPPLKSIKRNGGKIPRTDGQALMKPSPLVTLEAPVTSSSSPATPLTDLASSPLASSPAEMSSSPLSSHGPIRPIRRMRASNLRSAPSPPHNISAIITGGGKGKGKLPAVDAFHEADSSGMMDSPPREVETIKQRRGPERVPEYRNSGTGSKAELVDLTNVATNETTNAVDWPLPSGSRPGPIVGQGETTFPNALGMLAALADGNSEESKGGDRSPAAIERARTKALARLDKSFLRDPTPPPAPEPLAESAGEFTAQEIGAHSTPRATRIPRRNITWAPNATVKQFQVGEEKQPHGLRNIFQKGKQGEKEVGTENSWNHGYFDLMNRAHVAMGECVDRSLKTTDKTYQTKMAFTGHNISEAVEKLGESRIRTIEAFGAAKAAELHYKCLVESLECSVGVIMVMLETSDFPVSIEGE